MPLNCASGSDLDQTVGTHEIDLAALAKAEVVDQLRQLFHAQAQPGDTDHFAGLLDLQVDEQRQFSGGAIVVDVQGARLVAVEEGIEPGISRFGPAEGAVQTFFGDVVIGVAADDQRSEGFMFGADAFQILREGCCFATVFTRGQPVAHHAVAGDVFGGGQRLDEDAFDVVARRFDARRQRLFDQIALGEAVDHQGINANHDQDADQQGGAHAENQLPLNTASPQLHGAPPKNKWPKQCNSRADCIQPDRQSILWLCPTPSALIDGLGDGVDRGADLLLVTVEFLLVLLLHFDLLRAQVHRCQHQQTVTDQRRVFAFGVGQSGLEHQCGVQQGLFFPAGALIE